MANSSDRVFIFFAYRWAVVFSITVVHHTFRNGQELCAACKDSLIIHLSLIWMFFGTSTFTYSPISSFSPSKTFFFDWFQYFHGMTLSHVLGEEALFLQGIQAVFDRTSHHGFFKLYIPLIYHRNLSLDLNTSFPVDKVLITDDIFTDCVSSTFAPDFWCLDYVIWPGVVFGPSYPAPSVIHPDLLRIFLKLQHPIPCSLRPRWLSFTYATF